MLTSSFGMLATSLPGCGAEQVLCGRKPAICGTFDLYTRTKQTRRQQPILRAFFPSRSGDGATTSIGGVGAVDVEPI